jgi:hypothetical protein
MSEKKIKWRKDEHKKPDSDDWRNGYLLGFGVDYDVQENGLGIACGSVTRAIVKTAQGEFLLLPLNCIFEE